MKTKNLKELVDRYVTHYQESKGLWDMRRVDYCFYDQLKQQEPNSCKRLEFENMYEKLKRRINEI